MDDNSAELSRISQLFLDQKGLDHYEYVDYVRDEDEYCDELGLTLFIYITKIKIGVFLKDGDSYLSRNQSEKNKEKFWWEEKDKVKKQMEQRTENGTNKKNAEERH